MTVKAILSRKGSDVVTIAPTANLVRSGQASRRTSHRRAWSSPAPDNRVAGILSERDIVRALA